jgi:putative DNA primase/helicase
MSDLRQIAAALGGEVCGQQVRAPEPGHSPRDRSLSVRLTADGFIVNSFAGDDWQTCRDYVRGRLGLPQWQPGDGRYGSAQSVSRHSAAPVPSPQTNGQNSDAERTARALALWNGAEPLSHLALAYLASRGIHELPLPDVDGVLRFHSCCAFGPGKRHPCILALLRDVITNEPTGIHRTALTGTTGQKLGRMTLGVKSGAAIKLWPDEDVTLGLVIGEGLETTLSAATRIEYRDTLLQPAWAVSDASNMESLPVLPGIDAITILVDHDESGTGQQAARTCAERWVSEGREAILLTPRDAGADFSDLTKAITP